MHGCELTVGISALALAIASQIEDIDDLTLLGAIFTQLGDSIDLIAIQRERCKTRCEKQEE